MSVLVSNLCWNTGFPSERYSWFTSATLSKFRDCILSSPRLFPFKSFPNRQPTYHSTLRMLSVDTDSFVKSLTWKRKTELLSNCVVNNELSKKAYGSQHWIHLSCSYNCWDNSDQHDLLQMFPNCSHVYLTILPRGSVRKCIRPYGFNVHFNFVCDKRRQMKTVVWYLIRCNTFISDIVQIFLFCNDLGNLCLICKLPQVTIVLGLLPFCGPLWEK